MTTCRIQLPVSDHAETRQAQRSVRDEALLVALTYGDEYRQPAGRIAYFVGRRAVRRARKEGVDISAHVNTAIILADDSTVVTVVRANNPKRIKNCQ